MAKMTASEAFVETMVANGVKDIFGIMGSAFMDAMDIFEPAGIRLVPVVHEQGAAHMADGYSRVSGKHGVCIGQNGPGISNCVTAIAAAYWAHSPVVIVTPEAGTGGIGLGGFQETNQLPMFQEFTKYQGHDLQEKSRYVDNYSQLELLNAQLMLYILEHHRPSPHHHQKQLQEIVLQRLKLQPHLKFLRHPYLDQFFEVEGL